MWTFKMVTKFALLKAWGNMQFWKSDQMCTFEGDIKCALLKEWSNVQP